MDKETNDEFLKENKFIFKKYKPIKKLDQGAFGNIYSAIRLTDKSVFAMKTEKKTAEIKSLESEAFFLFTLQNGFGFPKLISYGHTKNYNILIETLFDKSLFNMFIKKKRNCNLIDASLIGLQILDRLEYIHSKDIVYRDVKPENFLIGINDPNVIYIVDFGLCKKYRSSKTGKHLLPKLTGKFSGTLLYASSYVLRGKESSRRDDLISLGYMLIYLLKRNLPFNTSFKNLNKTQYYEIVYYKETNGGGKLFKDMPQEIIDYIKYTRNLKFEQDPDYSYLRSLFKNILFDLKFSRHINFSWIDPKNKKLLGIPKNSSLRKISPQSRILKTMSDRRKIYSQKNFSLNNIMNKSNNISIIKNDNNNYSKKDFNSNYIDSEKNKGLHEKAFSALNIAELNNNLISLNNKSYSPNNRINSNEVSSEKIIKNDQNRLISNSIINYTNDSIGENNNKCEVPKLKIDKPKYIFSEKVINKNDFSDLKKNYINNSLSLNNNLYSPEGDFNKKIIVPKRRFLNNSISLKSIQPINMTGNNLNENYKNILNREDIKKYQNKNKMIIIKKNIPLNKVNKRNLISQKIINTNIYLNNNKNSFIYFDNKEIKDITDDKKKEKIVHSKINKNKNRNINYYKLNINTNNLNRNNSNSNNIISNIYPKKINYNNYLNNILSINGANNINNSSFINKNRYHSPLSKYKISSINKNKYKSPLSINKNILINLKRNNGNKGRYKNHSNLTDLIDYTESISNINNNYNTNNNLTKNSFINNNKISYINNNNNISDRQFKKENYLSLKKFLNIGRNSKRNNNIKNNNKILSNKIYQTSNDNLF